MHQVKYFLAVCSERNFSRAARLCQVSQPSLTRAIKLLEAELGGLLFRRNRGCSQLTELGEIVRPHLQNVWDKSEAAIATAQRFTAASGLVEVTASAAARKPVSDCER
jgi:DNA-binding transcriptional LysR family regulator